MQVCWDSVHNEFKSKLYEGSSYETEISSEHHTGNMCIENKYKNIFSNLNFFMDNIN
jgi:hypothetical protein